MVNSQPENRLHENRIRPSPERQTTMRNRFDFTEPSAIGPNSSTAAKNDNDFNRRVHFGSAFPQGESNDGISPYKNSGSPGYNYSQSAPNMDFVSHPHHAASTGSFTKYQSQSMFN